MPRIVTINATETEAPAPITLQQTGFVTSMFATNLPAGKTALLTQLSDLAPLIDSSGTINITSIAWAANVATVTYTGAAQTVGDVVSIMGSNIDAYNGTWVVVSSTSGSFTFALAAPSTPGVPMAPGSFVSGNVVELTAMVTTFFAQGNSVGVYVFETETTVPTTSVSTLSTFITDNPFQVYAITVPRSWDGNESFLGLIPSDEALTAKLYFMVTTTSSTHSSYTALMKDVVALVEAPTLFPNATTGVLQLLRPSTEFSIAGFMQVILRQQPSAANQVCPFCFTFLFGVTPFPILGNNAFLDTLAAASVNFIWTGSEGGISTALMYPGETMDGNDFLFWYSVDWFELNIDEDLSNAVINGSNNPLAPLYFNQTGINTLQDVAQQTAADAIAFGLALGPITVNAIGLAQYIQQNPQQFEDEEYNGLSVTYTPNKGFRSLTFNANISQLPAGAIV